MASAAPSPQEDTRRHELLERIGAIFEGDQDRDALRERVTGLVLGELAALALENARLRETNRELEAMTCTISHDLRAPLRHIGGFTDLLVRHAAGALDDKGRRYVQTIGDAARQMGTLLDALLDFSRVGRVELARSRMSAVTMVRDVIRELEPDLHHRAVEWLIGPLPEIEGDPNMLRLVFANLISNAVKVTRLRDAARIEIGVESPGSGETVFFVRDNGVGFNMEDSSKLFGIFQRLHTDAELEGTGLGLASVRRIVTRHGGRVWAEGEEGRGATFYFTLPATPVS
jgi:two-component system, chemotaxis family, sensor kinase Cph1